MLTDSSGWEILCLADFGLGGGGGRVLLRTILVLHSTRYSRQFEHTGSSVSHLIFLVKHRSQAVVRLSRPRPNQQGAQISFAYPFDAYDAHLRWWKPSKGLPTAFTPLNLPQSR